MPKYLFFFTVCLLFFSCSDSQSKKTIKLNENWVFSKMNDTIWYQATVPGVVHTDLLANNLIEDPYFETNEIKLQWIENENWVYKTIFNLTQEQISQENIEIEFEGLDTYATVFLNGTKIVMANNMFRSWKAAIKQFVKVGENKLEIDFISPVNFNKEKVEKADYELPSGNETVPLKVSAYTRKAAYHFGWDWGPRFVTSGIWRDVKITTWNKARITDVFIQTDSIINAKAYMTYNVTIESKYTDKQYLNIHFDNQVKDIKLKKGFTVIKHKVVVENPTLWWPSGMGKANLNTLKVTLKKGDKLLDSKSQSYGIRTVALIQEKDAIGTSFYFKVNGKPLFVKGANYIPQDMFLPRVKISQYEKLIGKVVAANMNMLRVWGGGIYENDIFYDLCDKNGILIWQDFMFSGSLYPNDKEFIDNITNEVTENVTRLRKHPSIALWCGNNEIDVAWHNWGWQKQFKYTPKQEEEVWHNYLNIFKKIIPTIVKELDYKTDYVSTSPLSNWGTPKNFNHSSMHYWGVWHGREPFESFKTNVGRFMVEYGFQSFPSMETIRTFTMDTRLSLDSKTMQNRQKSYIGNGLITNHINKWFDKPHSFADFVEKSQKTQAIAMQMAIQSHRQKTPHCMGTLFWQLNDCWQGPSWSVIDYFGNEKIAYKTVSENYKALIAVLDLKQKSVEIISDAPSDFLGVIKIKQGHKTFSKNISVMSNSRLKIAVKGILFNTSKEPISVVLIKNSKVVFSDKVFIKREE